MLIDLYIDRQPAALTKSNRPRLDGKVIHYHSDGTGRDNYITFESFLMF